MKSARLPAFFALRFGCVRSRLRLALCGGIVGAAFLAAPSHADTVSFQQGVSGYSGTRDTKLVENFANTNYSGDVQLEWDLASSGFIRQALIRFDGIFGNSVGQIPAGSTVLSASLIVTESTGGTGDSASLHRILRSWSDTETWNDWVNGVQTDGIDAAISADATTGAIAANQVVQIDVTASLQAWAQAPSSNYGWAILASGNDGTNVWSAEGTSAPILQVAFVPEPACVSLLALGFLALLRRR